MKGFDSQRFECDCHSFHHTVRFVFDEEDGTLTVDVALNSWLPWYRRLWRAIIYVFRPGRSRYGHYDEVILKPQDYARLKQLIEKAETHKP